MTTQDTRYIRRINNPRVGTIGWEARIRRIDVAFTKFFSDNVWGGEQAALAAARQWRDQQADMQPRPLRNVYRVDKASGTHGWQVLVRRVDGQVSKLFSDGVWGGRDAALAAALQWRDQKLGIAQEWALDTPRLNVPLRQRPLASANLKRYEIPAHADGRSQPSAFWVASWVDENGIALQRKFSVTFWGEEAAKCRAQEVIDQQWQRMAGASMRSQAKARRKSPAETAKGDSEA